MRGKIEIAFVVFGLAGVGGCWMSDEVGSDVAETDIDVDAAVDAAVDFDSGDSESETQGIGDSDTNFDVDSDTGPGFNHNLRIICDNFQSFQNECCTRPEDFAECWVEDAHRDGVTCTEDNAATRCASGSCADFEADFEANFEIDMGRCVLTVSLCTCAQDDECATGICREGFCRPSSCNGYQVCSCYGGCAWWWSQDSNRTFTDFCADMGLLCLEGDYPVDPLKLGYCTSCCAP